MDALILGPLALPWRVAAPLGALGVANLAAMWWQRRRGIDARPALWQMTLWGFLAARAAFVLKHLDTYAGTPLQMLNIRDGGFVAFAGLLAATAVGFEQVRRTGALRRPLLGAALAGILVWTGALAALHAVQPSNPKLPDLALRRLEGGEVRLGAFAGRPLVVNLWATWCPPCRREMPALGAAQAARPDVGFVFANQGEDPQAVRRYLAAEGLVLREVLLDAPGQLARATGVAGYPTTLFYDRQGVLIGRHMGELSPAQLEEQLAALRERR